MSSTPAFTASSELGGQPNTTDDKQSQSRKKRLRLSCIECRKKKLSCDRSLPCRRCVKSGRPEQCTFESGPGQPLPASNRALEQHAQRNSGQIKDLQAEVAHLKTLLSEVRGQSNHSGIVKASPGSSEAIQVDSLRNATQAQPQPNDTPPIGLESRELSTQADDSGESAERTADADPVDPRKRSPRGYYGRHTLFQFFDEMRDLFPIIEQINNEYLRPRGVPLSKKKAEGNYKKPLPAEPGRNGSLEHLLPPKDDSDILVTFYIDHFEHLHRVVHVPTFRREYDALWVPGRPRHPAMLALTFVMMAASTCTLSSDDDSSIATRYRKMAELWIVESEAWLSRQSPKHRKIIHYQVACILYLSKRAHLIRKKTYWKQTTALIQDAIGDGLHLDPTTDSFYMREMKRRIWAVLAELDLQNSYEYGLPILLHNLDYNVAPPANLDDEDFDENTKNPVPPKPATRYTQTSFQYHCSRSWQLRLEISQRMFSAKLFAPLSYDEVLKYTHQVTQAMDAIPNWPSSQRETEEETTAFTKQVTPTYVFLRLQLMECIRTLHRPYIQHEDGRFWLSETTNYHIARDMLLMNCRLTDVGLRTLAMLRSDITSAWLTLVRLTMLQSKDSPGIALSNSQSTLELLERCLPFVEDPYLRCATSERWVFLTMCGAFVLLRYHLGEASWQAAKQTCGQKFLDLHYRNIGRQQVAILTQQSIAAAQPAEYAQVPYNTPEDGPAHPTSVWLDSNFSEFSIDTFDLDVGWDWEGTLNGWSGSTAL